MFDKISIKGFRGITQLEIDDLRRINLFVGQNNCGKTSIMEAVCLLLYPLYPHFSLKYSSRGSNRIDDDIWRSIFNEFSIDSAITLIGELENPRETRILTIKPKIGDSIVSDGNSDNLELDGLELDYAITGETNEVVKHNSTIRESDIERKHQENQISSHFGSRAGNLVTLFDRIQRSKRMGHIVKILNNIDASIENLLIGSDNKLYCDIGIKRLIPINMMGDGILKLLDCIMRIYMKPNNILPFDSFFWILYL